MSPASRPSPETPDRHRQITEAALVCFSRSGFHGASMQDICAEAGMSAGALYRYFPSKAAIIVAIAEAEREQHALMFEPLQDAPDPLAALQELGEAFLAECLSGAASMLGADVMAEAGRNPEVRDAFEKNAAFARDALRRALERGQRLGLVDPTLDVPAASLLILALGDGLCTLRGGATGLEPHRIAGAMTLLLTRFCRPPSASGAAS